MRIRTVKPEFWTSEDVAALDWHTRLLFIGLWSYVDDNGVGRDVDQLIAAALFPLERDPRETLATVSRGLQTLSDQGQITRYHVDGKPYLEINAWAQHQRIDKPNKPRYPSLTCGNAVIRDTLATPSRDPRETLAPGTEEQRNRGTGEQGNSSELANARSLALVSNRDDVEHLCTALADRIEANGSKRPTITDRWRTAARLMIDNDGRSHDDVLAAIHYSQTDEFWRANVLSMPKLREKYDQLRLQAARQATARPSRQQQTDDLFARAAARASQEGPTPA